jgi:cytochrome c oxidase subunit 3
MFREVEAMEEWIGLGRPLSRRATRWLLATLFFGGVFLTGQCLAWQQLVSQHIYVRHSPSIHYFYLLTGLHALHLLIGVGALATALYMLQRSRSMETRRVWVDCSVWYWHAMGVLWLLLLALLEFGQ